MDHNRGGDDTSSCESEDIEGYPKRVGGKNDRTDGLAAKHIRSSDVLGNFESTFSRLRQNILTRISMKGNETGTVMETSNLRSHTTPHNAQSYIASHAKETSGHEGQSSEKNESGALSHTGIGRLAKLAKINQTNDDPGRPDTSMTQDQIDVNTSESALAKMKQLREEDCSPIPVNGSPGTEFSRQELTNKMADETDMGMVLNATELISIFETGAMRVAKSGQMAIFEENISMSSVRSKSGASDRINVYPLSRIRTVTESNKSSLRRAFQCDGTDKFVWLQNMGNIVLAISSADIGLNVEDDDVTRHSVWGQDRHGEPSHVYSYKAGREPVVPRHWVTDGRIRLPKHIKYGIVDGAVRATFITEEAPYIKPTISLWVFPEKMFSHLLHNQQDFEERKRCCLTTVLTTVAHRLNISAHSVAKNTFAQIIEQIARKRTTECSNSQYNVLFQGQDLENDSDSCTSQDSSQALQTETSDKWGKAWRFPTNEEKKSHAQKAKPKPNFECVLRGSYFPIEYQAFAVRHSVSGIELADSWFDRMFVSGRLFWNDQLNSAEHVCIQCTPLKRIIARDLATTTWLELLHQRDTATSNGKMRKIYSMSTSWALYRDVNPTMTKLVKSIFGVEGEMQLGTKGRADSFKVKVQRAVIQGELSFLKYEVFNITGYGIIRRLDIHAEKLDCDSSSIGLRRLVMVPIGTPGKDVVRGSRDKMAYRLTPAPTNQKELLSIAFERSMLASEGVYRICTQLLGFYTANVVINKSRRCPKFSSGFEKFNAAQFFAQFSWHCRPSYQDIQRWCGGSRGVQKRLHSSYYGKVLPTDSETIQWGMYRLDKQICEAVFSSLPAIRNILIDVIETDKYDKDIWASQAKLGTISMRDTMFGFLGETVDHLIIYSLYQSFESKEKGLWEKKMMSKRIEQVYLQVEQDRKSKCGGHSFASPITDDIDVALLRNVKYKHIKYMLRPKLSGTSGYDGIIECLPELSHVDVEICEAVRKPQDSTPRKNQSPDYRTMTKLPLWRLHVGYLTEICKRKSEEDISLDAFVKSVAQIMSGVALHTRNSVLSTEDVEDAVKSFVTRETENPLQNIVCDAGSREEMKELFRKCSMESTALSMLNEGRSHSVANTPKKNDLISRKKDNKTKSKAYSVEGAEALEKTGKKRSSPNSSVGRELHNSKAVPSNKKTRSR